MKTGKLEFGGEDFADLARSMLEEGIPVKFTARGGSMEPAFSDGDRVTILPCCQEEVEEGDTVAFILPCGSLAVHRVIEIFEKDNGTWFRAKGDRLSHPDSAVHISGIIGKAKRFETRECRPRRKRRRRPRK